MHTETETKTETETETEIETETETETEARDKEIGTDTVVGMSVKIRWLQNSLAYSAVIIGGFNVSEGTLVQKMPNGDVLLRNRLFLRHLTYVQGYRT